VLSVFPGWLLPVLETKEKQYTGTAGVKGQIAGWDYDASLTGNRSTCAPIRNSVNYSLPYPGSPTDFYDGKLDYQQGIANLTCRGFEVAAFVAAGGERGRRVSARAVRARGRAVGVVYRLRRRLRRLFHRRCGEGDPQQQGGVRVQPPTSPRAGTWMLPRAGKTIPISAVSPPAA
jgi:hypothetical protein